MADNVTSFDDIEFSFNELVVSFEPEFSDFITLYRGVERVWISGAPFIEPEDEDKDGILFAEMQDGVIQTIGPVSGYFFAQKNGFEGSFSDWVQVILDGTTNAQIASAAATSATSSAQSAAASAQTASQKADAVKSPTIVITYQNSSSGTTIPSGTWVSTPDPQKGMYLWKKTVSTWGDLSTTTSYDVSYSGEDGYIAVASVNGKTGAVVLYASDITMSDVDNTTISQKLVPITNNEIDSLFV